MHQVIPRSLKNPVELLEIFPEAKKIIPLKIVGWQEREAEIIEIIKQNLTRIKSRNLDQFSEWFWKKWLGITDCEELLKIRDHISRLERLQSVSEGCASAPRGSVSPAAIEQARSVPIQDLINQPMRKSGRTFVGLCPLHKEKNPSFYIYQETNSFFCFGCHVGGDVIEFIRLQQGFSFREAIGFLNGKNE